MRDLFEILVSNPVLALIVLGSLVSVFGKVIGKAATRAAEKAAANRRELSGEAPPPNAARQPQAQPRRPPLQEQPTPAAQPKPAAADLAQEIRRLMGMEPAAPPSRRRAETPRQVETPRPVVEPEQAPDRGHLAERLAAEQSRPRSVGTLERRDAHLGERISERYLQQRAPRQLGRLQVQEVKKVRSTRRRVLDIAHPSSALVSFEVFGPPRALRGWDS